MYDETLTNNSPRGCFIVFGLLALIFIGIIVGNIYEADWFQKMFYPKKYWSLEVAASKKTLSTYVSFMDSSYANLKKIKYYAENHRNLEIESRKIPGSDDASSLRYAEEDLDNEIAAAQQDFDYWSKQVNMAKESLVDAQNKLRQSK